MSFKYHYNVYLDWKCLNKYNEKIGYDAIRNTIYCVQLKTTSSVSVKVSKCNINVCNSIKYSILINIFYVVLSLVCDELSI